MSFTREEYQQMLNRHAPKPSKYRNTKVVVNGEKFDSKREAAYYQELLLREKVGEVRKVQRQVSFMLCAPELLAGLRQKEPPVFVHVADYVADFTFEEVCHADQAEESSAASSWRKVVVDVKGMKTQTYLLKKKWLELQSGIEIREIR